MPVTRASLQEDPELQQKTQRPTPDFSLVGA